MKLKESKRRGQKGTRRKRGHQKAAEDVKKAEPGRRGVAPRHGGLQGGKLGPRRRRVGSQAEGRPSGGGLRLRRGPKAGTPGPACGPQAARGAWAPTKMEMSAPRTHRRPRPRPGPAPSFNPPSLPPSPTPCGPGS